MPPKAGNAPDSFKDGLSNLLHDIADCLAAPDADMQFCMKLQQVVLLKMKSGGGQPQGQPGGMGGGPAGPPGGAGGAPAGMGMPGGPPGGGAANQAMQSQGAPVSPAGVGPTGGVTRPLGLDPEEVRRVMAEQAGSGAPT